MWAKWKGNTRLIWVHKIIKQVQGGWKIEMREIMRNSKRKSRQRIESQGKGEANAKYGKQQLDIKKTQGFKWSRTFEIESTRKQATVKKLKRPIAIPMFTTNPNQHTVAHLLAWLPLHNKRKERTTKEIRRKERRRRHELAPNRQCGGGLRPSTRRATNTT
jgi:hypothetical protein